MICTVVIVINLTSVWTDFDQKTLDRAKIRCGQIYKDAPCLKRFTKKKEREYTAACGEGKNENLLHRMFDQ